MISLDACAGNAELLNNDVGIRNKRNPANANYLYDVMKYRS